MYVNLVVVMHRFLVNYFIHNGRMSVSTSYFELNFVWEVRFFNGGFSVKPIHGLVISTEFATKRSGMFFFVFLKQK